MFSGYLLLSDMDNTLLNDEHKVSEKDKEAIKYFIDNGGYFSVATGRAVFSVKAYQDKFMVNAPVILHNGAVIYDLKEDKLLYKSDIEQERKEAIRKMRNLHPDIGIEIYCNEIAYIYSECSITNRLKERGYPVIYGVSDEVWNDSWAKVLMIASKEDLDRYEKEYKELDKGYSVRSGDMFFDIVSNNASKANGMETVSKILGINKDKIVAIGDNMNDITMLLGASISYAVSNAKEDAKKAADFITPSNNDSPISWVIEDLKKRI